jgi:hypothetical protein
MIWTTAQVAVMEGYRCSQAVDMFAAERAALADGTNPLLEYVADHLWHNIQDAAATRGLSISREDVEVQVKPDPDGHMLDIVRMRWNPQTTSGLLIGGPAGGKVYPLPPEVHRRGVSVVVQDHSKPLFDNSAAVDVVATKTLFYQYAGWSEDRRMWVYRVVSEK